MDYERIVNLTASVFGILVPTAGAVGYVIKRGRRSDKPKPDVGENGDVDGDTGSSDETHPAPAAVMPWYDRTMPPESSPLSDRLRYSDHINQVSNDCYRAYLVGSDWRSAKRVRYVAKLNTTGGESTNLYDIVTGKRVWKKEAGRQGHHSARWNRFIENVGHRIPYPSGAAEDELKKWAKHGRDCATLMGAEIEYVALVAGDLLDQPVEVIVNPWNRNIIPWWLLLPRGVSGAIKRRGGTEPFEELRSHGAIPLGGAFLTSAGRLPYKGIIHVAGINLLWRASERSIRDSVKNAVQLAHEKGFRSMAFPLVGAGSGGFDPERAKQVMIDEFQRIDLPIDVTVVVFEKC